MTSCANEEKKKEKKKKLEKQKLLLKNNNLPKILRTKLGLIRVILKTST